MSDLQPILNLLPSEWRGHVVALCAVIGMLRLLVKPFGEMLKRTITRAAETAISSANKDDDHWIIVVLEFPGYRLAAFLLDLVASVKLPHADDLFAPQPKPDPKIHNSTTEP